MKATSEIESRIRYLLVQELNARVQLAERRLPHLCTHNHRQPLDVRKTVEGEHNEDYNRITRGSSLPVAQTIGLCMLGAESPSDWPGNICEDPIDAQRCPYFNPRFNKQALWTSFAGQIRDPEWLQVNMAEVYGLLWSLNAAELPKMPAWKRFWYRLLRIRVEPLRPREDPANLLPPWEP
jgi:hypothetical protein